jgi:hypothetical protein
MKLACIGHSLEPSIRQKDVVGTHSIRSEPVLGVTKLVSTVTIVYCIGELVLSLYKKVVMYHKEET